MHSLLQLAAASQQSYHPSPGREFRSLVLVAVLLVVGISLLAAWLRRKYRRVARRRKRARKRKAGR
jgi:hypothetical protein